MRGPNGKYIKYEYPPNMRGVPYPDRTTYVEPAEHRKGHRFTEKRIPGYAQLKQRGYDADMP